MKRVLLFLSLCLMVMAEKQKGRVEFKFENVQVTCPGESPSWHGDKIQQPTGKTIQLTGNEGLVYCNYQDDQKKNEAYFFYIKGKVCEMCYELSDPWLYSIILGDLLLTVGVMITTYYCAQRKSKAAASSIRQASSANCEYESLDPRTRDNDIYNVSGAQRTG